MLGNSSDGDRAETNRSGFGDAPLGSFASAAHGADTQGATKIDWDKVAWFVRHMMGHYRLLAAIIVVSIPLIVLYYLTTSPIYTATAVLGPPGPTPSATAMGLGGSLPSVGRMLGGAGNSGREPFQDFLQLLPSSRLSQALLARDDFRRIVFKAQWDPATRQWREGGSLHKIVAAAKRSLNIPQTPHPDIDTVTQFLSTHLVTASSNRSISGGLLGRTNPYVNVSFSFGDPAEAEMLLNMILAETDQIVREDEGRDVAARIGYLRTEMLRTDHASDERSALISILSSQEQLQAMIRADQRYASNLIVTPHTPLKPTSPNGPGKIVMRALVLSIAVWVVLVLLSLRFPVVRRSIAWSNRNSLEATARPPTAS